MKEVSVSIIIPCRNEEKYIERCVLSVLECEYPKELITVYVVDGMSDDNTVEIVKNISKTYPQVQLLENHKRTTPFALNIGLRRSDEDVKIILGAHSEVDKQFLKENIETLKIDPFIMCAGGVLENVYENKAAEIIGKAMSSPFGVGNAHFRTGAKDGYVDTVAFGAYRNELFDKIGYFDEELARNQDDEFNFRLLKSGYKIYLNSKIKCRYFVRGSFKKLYKQYYQYGFWKVFVNKKHKEVTTIRQLIPPMFVAYLLVFWMLLFANQYLFLLYISGVLFYLIAAMFFAAKKSSNVSEIFQISYCFLLLHISYGSGYLKGIIDFLVLNKRPNQNVKMTR